MHDTACRPSLRVLQWPAEFAPFAGRRTGSLAYTGEGDISARLGFQPTRHSVEGISDQEWLFTVDGVQCAIWDWRGAGRHGCWSTFGPASVFAALFGWRAGA